MIRNFISRTVIRTGCSITVGALLLCAGFGMSVAQDLPITLDAEVPGVEQYRGDIPTPEEVFGHTIGEQHTRPHEVVEYFRRVAEMSDRVIVRQHGQTYENRPLIHAVVASAENQQRLEEIRKQNQQLSSAPESVSDQALEDMPAVVNMVYSVHGDEASGSEAAVLLLYHLAAGEGPAIDEALENLVVLIDPLLNPDGRDRFVDWVNGNRGAVPTTDLQDREHNQSWPGGRRNHYLFDLNRDWLPAQHPESKGRVEVFHRWRPQLQVDVHEMGRNNTYFFQPGVPGRTNPFTPERNQELTAQLAEYHADALNRIRSFYFTREIFDDFYYGKASTYPDVQGAVGILFEQASSRALETMTNTGKLTYPETVYNQFTTSLGSLEGAVQMRTEFLRYQRDFFAQADDLASERQESAYLLDGDTYPIRALELVRLMQRQRIRVHHLAEDVEVDGERYEAGADYIVPLNQPQARLVASLMERQVNFQDSLFYDVSTWTMPLAFGVEDAALERSPSSFVGEEVAEDAVVEGALRGEDGELPYAYLMEWGDYYAPRAVYRALKRGMYPRVAFKPFTAVVDGQRRQFDRGTVIIPVQQRGVPEGMTGRQVQALVKTMVSQDHVRIYAVDGGLTPSGPDLGGASTHPLHQPKVAILAGEGTSTGYVGEAWHLLSERMKMPVSLINLDEVPDFNLDKYNTIVVGGTWIGSSEIQSDLRNWVRDGGLLITMGGSSRWAIQEGLIEEKLKAVPDDTSEVSYAERPLVQGAEEIGGSIFQATLDTTHPLAFGYGEEVALFKNNRVFIQPSSRQAATVAQYTAEPLLSGYISDENLSVLSESAAIIGRRVGSGRIVLFADDPNFRAFWWGTNGLFLNTIFFGRQF